MKRLTTVIALLVLCFSVYSQKGVKFDTIPFSEALTKAKTEKKLIFMDCYTAWCGPCKLMLKNVLTQEKVGQLFNPNFVCIKFDMEKEEGKALAQKYNIHSYPTFLLIQPDGTVQHKIIGAFGIEEFIEKIQRGMNEKTSYYYLDSLYANNKLNKKQLIAYQAALNDAYENEKSKHIHQVLIDQITDTDKLDPDFWPLLSKSHYGNDYYHFIINHLDKLRKNISTDKVDSYLFNTYENALNNSIWNWGNGRVCQNMVTQIKQDLSNIHFISKEKLADKISLAQACADTNNTQIITIVEKILPQAEGVEFIHLFKALEIVKAKGSPKDYDRIATMGKHLIAKTTDPSELKYFHTFFDSFKPTNTLENK